MKTRAALRRIRIPWTGYFAVGPDGKPRHGYARKYIHKVPVPPEIGLEDSIVPFGSKPELARPFKSFLVDSLARLRDNGPASARDCRALIAEGATEWLEGNGLIQAVKISKNDPLWVECIYQITSTGLDFLKIHEAPECWA